MHVHLDSKRQTPEPELLTQKGPRGKLRNELRQPDRDRGWTGFIQKRLMGVGAATVENDESGGGTGAQGCPGPQDIPPSSLRRQADCKRGHG